MVYFAALLLIAKAHLVGGFVGDYILTVFTITYLWLLLSHREVFSPRLFTVRVARETARFSYTLYAAHTPLLVFLASVILGDTRWVFSFAHLAFTILITLAAASRTPMPSRGSPSSAPTPCAIRLEALFGMRSTPPVPASDLLPKAA